MKHLLPDGTTHEAHTVATRVDDTTTLVGLVDSETNERIGTVQLNHLRVELELP